MTQDPVAHLAAALGEDTIRDVVARFYVRVPADDILAPMYPPDDLAGAERRLADFLVMRLGGSTRYAETRGHPRLRMRHAKFTIDRAARNRWMEHMDASIRDAELPEPHSSELREFLADVATFLINRAG